MGSGSTQASRQILANEQYGVLSASDVVSGDYDSYSTGKYNAKAYLVEGETVAVDFWKGDERCVETGQIPPVDRYRVYDGGPLEYSVSIDGVPYFGVWYDMETGKLISYRLSKEVVVGDLWIVNPVMPNQHRTLGFLCHDAYEAYGYLRFVPYRVEPSCFITGVNDAFDHRFPPMFTRHHGVILACDENGMERIILEEDLSGDEAARRTAEALKRVLGIEA